MVCASTVRTSAASEPSAGDDANVLDKDSNIRVVVRVRPQNAREQASDNVIKVMGPHCLVFDPDQDDTDEFGNRSSGGRKQGVLGRKSRDLRFAFDRVLSDQTNNLQAYDASAKFVVDGVLSGFNCSVFAYGATGAGKTHTMLGTENEPGVMYRTMQDLYSYMAKVSDQCCVDVSVSYLEVYNEDVRDLLMPKRCSLPVREDPQQGVIVQGLSLHKPQSMEELLHMLDFGNTNRSQHPTDANSESSRSHAVFQVFIRQKPRGSGLQAKVRCAKMSLIDLAGSERATVTKNLGKRFREGANINRSLLALGNVINSLASGKIKGRHVPYRDSKLTRILKDSLGGNCRTVMIAAVSPSHLSYEDTYNTLRYAERTKSIKAEVKENVVSVDLHIHNYAKIVEELRQENRDLRAKLSTRPEPALAVVPAKTAMPEPDLLGWKVHVDNVYSARLTIHRELMEIEASDRELQVKVYYKRQSLARYQMICMNKEDTDSLRSRCEASCRGIEQRRTNLSTRRYKAHQRLRDNTAKLEQVHNDCRASTSDECLPEVVSLTDDVRRLEIELSDQKRQNKYLKKMVRQSQREMDVRDRLLVLSLTTLRQQYTDMTERGHPLPESYRQLIQLVSEQNREVVWADQTLNETDTSIFNVQQVLAFPPITPAGETPKRRTPRRKRSNRSPKNRSMDQSSKSFTVGATTSVVIEERQVTKAAGSTPFPKLSSLDMTDNGQDTTAESSRVTNCDNSSDGPHNKVAPDNTDAKNRTFTRPVPCAALFNTVAISAGDEDKENRREVNSATVTKAPAGDSTKDGVGGGKQRSHAVRSMNFNAQTPSKNDSYASAVKSPGAESPLPACVISPIPLTPSHRAAPAPALGPASVRTPSGSINRIRTEFCGSPLLSSSPKHARTAIDRPDDVPSPVLNESYTIRPASSSGGSTDAKPNSNTTATTTVPKTGTASSTDTLTPGLSRRPLTDQANVMQSRVPVRSPFDQRRRVQFQDQENRETLSKAASENAEKLEKYGLPSLLVSSTSNSKAPKRPEPGYMRMTHAAEGRARNGQSSRSNRSSQVRQSKEGQFKRSTSLSRFGPASNGARMGRTKSATQIPTR